MIKITKIPIAAVFFTALLYGTGLYALNFEDISANLDDTFEVRNALLQSENAYSAARLAEFPGDLQVSVTPGVKFTPETIEYYGSSTLKIPLGLSQAEKEKLSFSMDNFEIASARVEEARNEAFLTLYSLYQKAYLLQEEESVIRMELEAVRSKADIFVEQYKSGSITLSALSAAQRDLQDKKEELSQKLLEQRVSLYELAFTSGRAVREDLLDRFELKMDELPLPPELTQTAMKYDLDIIIQKTKVLQLQQTIDRLGKIDISASIKPFFSSGDHSVSVEYSFNDPMISAAYSFPLGSTRNIIAAWNTGISVSLSYNTGRTDKLDTEVLKTKIRQEEALLEYLTNLVSLKIRSSYQEYLKAKDSLEQSKRDLKQAMENMYIVKTKAALGQTAAYEMKEAEAQIKRAEWKVESSRVNLEKAYLNTINTASWRTLYE